MWLFTRRGFYSVVAHAGRPDKVIVRARCAAHLESLAELLGPAARRSARVTSTPEADYPFRMTVGLQAWLDLSQELAAEVDYHNFKEAAASEAAAWVGPEHARWVDLLHRVWAECREARLGGPGA